MTHRLIRVSNPAYLRLAQTAGKLQARLRHRVSLSDALDYLLYKKAGRARQFFSQLKERRNLLGRGPKRKIRPFKAPKTPASVHTGKNQLGESRRDVF